MSEKNWQPIRTAPFGVDALFLGELWIRPYVGVRNGDDGMVYLYGFNDPEHGWQSYDATRWMPITDPRGEGANALKRADEALGGGPTQAPIPAMIPQRDLPEDAAKILRDYLWSLYATGEQFKP